MQFFFQKKDKNEAPLFRQIERACEGLIYISETDSPVLAFSGPATDIITGEIILREGADGDAGPVEEISFDDFFARLTSLKEWFGERELARAKKFLELQELLEENLSQRKVFRVGRLRLSIFAVGIDKDGRLMGVTTRAVET